MSNSPLTWERLREVLSYEALTGRFVWRVTMGNAWKGHLAGSVGKNRRRHICIDGKDYYAYRLAWFYMRKSWPAEEIDHKDRDCSNDAWPNLREATHAINQQNHVGPRSTNKTTGIRGVHWSRRDKRFVASITVNRRLVHLGSFKELEPARLARLAVQERLHEGYLP